MLVASRSLCPRGIPELIVALDAAPDLYTVLYTIVGCGGASSSEAFVPRLHVPHRFRCEVVVSQE